MVSLARLRSVRRILAQDTSTFAASILVHCGGACPIRHYFLVQVIVWRGSLTLESVMLALCNFRGLKTAVCWRGGDWVGFSHLTCRIGHLLLKSQLLAGPWLWWTTVNRRSNISNRSWYFTARSCGATDHIQIFESTFNRSRLLMRSELHFITHRSSCLRESTMIWWWIEWDIYTWFVRVVVVDTTCMIHVLKISGVSFLKRWIATD